GSERLTSYSAFLKSTGELLWLVRAVLLASVLLHIAAAYQLTRIDARARPVAYGRREPQVSTLAARSIRWGGVLLLLFVVYHLLHFTFGTVHPAFDAKDVYGNMIAGFQVWWVVLVYLIAMIALGLHLYHGAWSSFRTLGLTTPSTDPLRRRVGMVVAIAIYGGFSIIPIAV